MILADFRAQYPEFATAPDDLVSRFLADTLQELNAATWGTYLDKGHGLLTAHRLSLAPNGAMSRLDPKETQTVYWQAYSDLRNAVTACLRVF